MGEQKNEPDGEERAQEEKDMRNTKATAVFLLGIVAVMALMILAGFCEAQDSTPPRPPLITEASYD